MLELNKSWSSTIKILVVDDERLLRESVVCMLKRAGYEVLSAEGPRQALEIVKNTAPVDVVVSDNQMPEMPGTQLIRELAQQYPNTAHVLMTGGRISPADVPNGVSVLRKPFLREDLISTVQAAIASSGRSVH